MFRGHRWNVSNTDAHVGMVRRGYSTKDWIMNIKPGDLFEWVHLHGDKPVLCGERLWSSTMDKWLLIEDRLCLCVAVNEQIIYWVSNRQLFHLYAPGARAIIRGAGSMLASYSILSSPWIVQLIQMRKYAMNIFPGNMLSWSTRKQLA